MNHDLTDSRDWNAVVTQLGGAAALGASAREHKAFIRARAVKDAATLLRLVLLYGPGGCSLRGAVALAAAADIANLTDVSLLERLCGSANWLEALCAERFGALAKHVGVTQERPIRIVDGTRIEGPAGRTFRLHLAYDLREGRISQATLTDLSGAEKLTRADVCPGEIRLADRGFPRPDDLATVIDAGADVVVRLTWKSLRLTDLKGTPLAWDAVFATADAHGTADIAVMVDKARAKGSWRPFRMRLVAIRKPPDAAASSRKKTQRASSKAQARIDPRTLKAAGYVLLLTSLSTDTHTAEQISALYRLRWQIELAIKRLKSILHIDRLPAKDTELARTWILSHLLLALLCDEHRARYGAFFP
jgi:hypothetical protein